MEFDKLRNREVSADSLLPAKVCFPFDGIVIMPYSENIGSNGSERLSYWSSQAVNAGLQLYEHFVADRIVIPGERLFGYGRLSTTELMNRFLSQRRVPQNAVIGLDRLNNSYYQLEGIKKLQEENQKLADLVYVCCGWHLERVADTLDNLGMTGSVVEVEAILATIWAQRKVTQLFGLPYLKNTESEGLLGDFTREKRKELLYEVEPSRKMALNDQKLRKVPVINSAAFQKTLVNILGGRVVDLHDSSFALFKDPRAVINDPNSIYAPLKRFVR